MQRKPKKGAASTVYISRGNLKRLDQKTRELWGRRLASLLQEREISAADLAGALFDYSEEGGYKSANGRDRISKYISGKSFPENETLGLIANHFRMSVEELLTPAVMLKLNTIKRDPVNISLHDNGTCSLKLSGSFDFSFVTDLLALMEKHGTKIDHKVSKRR